MFALNIEILLADVTKPKKSKILTLTWPVTSSVTSGSNHWPCTSSSRTGLSNDVLNLEIGPVVWEISGGGLCPPPPPAGRVINQTPAGRGLTLAPHKDNIMCPQTEPAHHHAPPASALNKNGGHCGAGEMFLLSTRLLSKTLQNSFIPLTILHNTASWELGA